VDAYLEGWGGTTPARRRAVSAAVWVGPIVRVLSLAGEEDGEAEITDLLTSWTRAAGR
jgi:hypothetical protein